ncbi:unnamed protein product [Arctogadus glacialis]
MFHNKAKASLYLPSAVFSPETLCHCSPGASCTLCVLWKPHSSLWASVPNLTVSTTEKQVSGHRWLQATWAQPHTMNHGHDQGGRGGREEEAKRRRPRRGGGEEEEAKKRRRKEGRVLSKEGSRKKGKRVILCKA